MSLVVRDAEIGRGAFRLKASFETPLMGVTVVFGPSGAGKSMLLSAIAGLVPLRRGRVSLAGAPVEDAGLKLRIPAHRRDIGLVFQDARLFPHLNVRGNLEFAARRAPHPPGAIDIEALAQRMDLADLLDRSVRTLSGGEKSRVALARALAARPSLLLLDEPFAALDGKRRREYLALLRAVSEEQDLPMLVVTHAVEDAAYLADHVVALRRGEVAAFGSAAEVMNGATFEGLLDARDAGARVASGRLAASVQLGKAAWVRADTVMVATRRPEGLSARNVWPGLVSRLDEEGDGSVLVRLAAEPGPICARISAEACRELDLTAGASVFVVVKTHAV